MAETYRNLIVWQRAMQLVTSIYSSTASFPASEKYGLTNQVRRAAVSVPSNIAEGKGRNSRREYFQFLCRARGSLYEVETQLEISRNLDYLSDDHADALVAEAGAVARVLNGLIADVQARMDEVPTADSRQPTAKRNVD